MWIVDDPAVEGPLNLPTGARDIPLMICDRSFDKRNRLKNPFKSPGRVPFDQVTGQHIMVNGAITPHANVAPRRHRLRLLNTSNFRAYNLRFSNGLGMVQIATEAGLMPTALRRSRILLGPGERVEIVVDFASARGKRIRLESVTRPGARRLGSKPYVGDIMEFRVGSTAVADDTAAIAHGDPLRPLPAWVDEVLADPLSVDPRPWTITVEGGIRPRWLINGEAFDPAEVDRTAEIGEVVTWRLRNNTPGRPPHAPPPHGLVHAAPERRDAAHPRAVPQGDVLPRSLRRDRGRRQDERLHAASTWSTATCSITRTTG